jgi:hypothetical protein
MARQVKDNSLGTAQPGTPARPGLPDTSGAATSLAQTVEEFVKAQEEVLDARKAGALRE